MRTPNHLARLARCLAWLAATSMLAGCMATTGTTKRTPARIDLQDDVGFTITEAVRISNAARSDYERALSLLQSGERTQGIEVLEQVVADSPQLSAPRIDLGIAWHRLGDLEAAEKHLQLALGINPEHPIALNEMGIVYRKTARFSAARESYEAALAVYPGFHFARRNLGVLCDLYLNDLGCALDNYEAYMATVANDDEAELWLKNVRFRMGVME